jgi:hypothetical protein
MQISPTFHHPLFNGRYEDLMISSRLVLHPYHLSDTTHGCSKDAEMHPNTAFYPSTYITIGLSTPACHDGIENGYHEREHSILSLQFSRQQSAFLIVQDSNDDKDDRGEKETR